MAVTIRTTVLEIKNAVIVVMFYSSYLNHNGLCGRLANSNYFYSEESIPYTDFRVRVTLFACTFRAES